MTGINTPVIPETVTVHLGPPDSDAQNVTVSFPDYIKNVASSEIYPTWPESAIRANILAEISFALNRIYTEYYRSRGYDFDITNSTAIDQSFVNGRDIFENIGRLVDEIFTDYLRREGAIEPLFAAYCDGIDVTCAGLSQWGSVTLAEEGRTPIEILQNYYGDNIELVRDAPVVPTNESYPGRILEEGVTGNDVKSLQVKLNRIAKNYPSIPKIVNADGIFAQETEDAVREFQRIFNLTVDGLVGRATWYKVQRIYSGVKSLSDLASEGIPLEDVTNQFNTTLSVGDSGLGVRELQYFLSFISDFINTIPKISTDGIYGTETAAAVEAFQREYGLPVTGAVDSNTWNEIYRAYIGMLESLPEDYITPTVPYGGLPLRVGASGDDVLRVQEYLNLISDTYTEIPKVDVDGEYGEGTAEAVRVYQRLFGIPETGIVAALTYNSIADTYRALLEGRDTSPGQFGGTIS